MSKTCPYAKCEHDHYEFSWLDEILFLNLGLDLTTKGTQHPVVPFGDLHEARAKIIAKLKGSSHD